MAALIAVIDGGGRADAHRQHRHLGVRGVERAVASAAEMVPAGEVDELPARRSRHEHLAGVRVRERGRRAHATVRHVVEEAEILVTVAARDDLAVLEEENDAGGRLGVEAARRHGAARRCRPSLPDSTR